MQIDYMIDSLECHLKAARAANDLDGASYFFAELMKLYEMRTQQVYARR